MKFFKEYYKELILISIPLIIIIVGLILYFINYNSDFSANSNDWANFAIFNGYFINVISMLIIGYISFLTFQTTQSFHKLQIQPLLYLTVDTPQRIANSIFKDSWYVLNAAKYPAINLLVRYCRDSNKYTKWVSCTSLAENQKIELFWIQYANKIEICFTDITKEKFYLFEFQDYNGKTKEIKKDEYQQNLNEAFDNRDNNITNLRDKFEKYVYSSGNRESLITKYIDDFIRPNLF